MCVCVQQSNVERYVRKEWFLLWDTAQNRRREYISVEQESSSVRCCSSQEGGVDEQRAEQQYRYNVDVQTSLCLSADGRGSGPQEPRQLVRARLKVFCSTVCQVRKCLTRTAFVFFVCNLAFSLEIE